MKIYQSHRREANDSRALKVQWRITLMSRASICPRTTIVTPSSIYCASDDVAFIAAPCCDWSEDLPYSEVMWLNAEEIRLLGSIMMTERFDGGQRCTFYPIPYCWLYLDPFPITVKRARALRDLVLNHLQESNSASLRAGILLNPLGRMGVCFPAARLQINLQPQLWKAVALDNYLLLRGIYALIKSDMLALNFEFREEAIINTFIALDASFQLVLRLLISRGNPNPSAKDAGNWLYKTFDEKLGLAYPADYRYFQEFYDDRIRTLHPGSRLGDFPYAPLAADDYSHLRSVLPGILSYLATGIYTPEFESLFVQRNSKKFQKPI